jgi:hypothetical protein
MPRFDLTVTGAVEAVLKIEADTAETAKLAATQLFEAAFETGYNAAYGERDKNGNLVPVTFENDAGDWFGMVTIDLLDCGTNDIDVALLSGKRAKHRA